MYYITILDFMVTDLGLKGNDLIVFALIYGFSQDNPSGFTGSLKYIQDRTGLSKPSVIGILKKLIENRLIIKEETFRNNLKLCSYRCSEETLQVVKKLYLSGKETLPETGKEFLPPILLNKNNKIKDNIYNGKFTDETTEVILYLNKTCNKNFRVESKKNRTNIIARLNDGYGVIDLKRVIDIKSAQWKGTEMDEWLNPETLFRPKNFERYLNTKIQTPKVDESYQSVEDEIPTV